MGRNSGYLALSSGIAGGAELVLIPEVKTTFDEIVETIKSAYVGGKSHCILIVAEGWKPGTRKLAEKLNERKDELGFSVRVTQLGHVQRGGGASAFDRVLATRMGSAAVKELVSGNAGNMIGWASGIVLTPLEEAIAYEKRISKDLYGLAQIMAK